MKQAFILPLPKSPHRIEAEEYLLDVVAETKFWQQTLDRLAEGKLDLTQELKKISTPSHPALRLSTTQESQTLLHLAVLFNRIDAVQSLLLLNPQLKYKPNALGLTPYELSLFLPRKEITQWFHPSPPPSFALQPNVAVTGFEDIEFLAQPLFQDEQVLKEILTQSKKAKMKDTIPPEKIWMGIYFDEEIQKGAHPKVSVQYINDKVKFGVFAENRIPSCAFVGEYTGVIQERRKKELEGKVYCVRYTVWDMGQRKFIIDAEKKGNFTRFINHSSQPNLGLQSVYWRGMPRMIFVALKEIPKGSQLTFDYGNFFWKEQKQTPVAFE
jgi:hypothetical protein